MCDSVLFTPGSSQDLTPPLNMEKESISGGRFCCFGHICSLTGLILSVFFQFNHGNRQVKIEKKTLFEAIRIGALGKFNNKPYYIMLTTIFRVNTVMKS